MLIVSGLEDLPDLLRYLYGVASPAALHDLLGADECEELSNLAELLGQNLLRASSPKCSIVTSETSDGGPLLLD